MSYDASTKAALIGAACKVDEVSKIISAIVEILAIHQAVFSIPIFPGGWLRSPPCRYSCSQPSLKRQPAAFPAASEYLFQKSREISAQAASQGTKLFLRISPSSERSFSEYVFFKVFSDLFSRIGRRPPGRGKNCLDVILLKYSSY